MSLLSPAPPLLILLCSSASALSFPYSSHLERSLHSLCIIVSEYILRMNPLLEKEILVVPCLQVTGITRRTMGKT